MHHASPLNPRHFRVTRTLFVFAELTNLDPNYTGPTFNFDTIIRELIEQVMDTKKRKR